MTRDLALQAALKTAMNDKEINSFFSYKIASADMTFLKETTTDILKNIPVKAFNCALLSALLN